MPQNIWTIHPTPGGGSNGNDLTGCHIQQTANGYELTAPNITNPLATTTATAAPFDFNNVSYQSLTWNIHVSTLPANANGSGSWATLATGPEATSPQSGDYTAQSGSGVDADADEAASSAKA